MPAKSSAKVPTFLNDRYDVGSRVGKGSFGVIHKGTDTETGQPIAIKFEALDCRMPQLAFEAKLYSRMPRGTRGVPKIYWFGEVPGYKVMVMELLGLSLADIFKQQKQKISLRSTLFLAEQALNRLEHLHQNNIIHRDIKPNNFLMGRVGHHRAMLYLLDYGLSKIYRTKKGHIPYRDDKKLTGTARYASLNAHLGRELSRRDDLESLGFMLVYLFTGSLPWQGNHGAKTRQEMYQKIKAIKQSTSIDNLCAKLPPQFAEYLHYCRALGFDERPDYDYLRKLWNSLRQQKGYRFDGVYDWTKPEAQSSIKRGVQEHYAELGFSRGDIGSDSSSGHSVTSVEHITSKAKAAQTAAAKAQKLAMQYSAAAPCAPYRPSSSGSSKPSTTSMFTRSNRISMPQSLATNVGIKVPYGGGSKASTPGGGKQVKQTAANNVNKTMPGYLSQDSMPVYLPAGLREEQDSRDHEYAPVTATDILHASSSAPPSAAYATRNKSMKTQDKYAIKASTRADTEVQHEPKRPVDMTSSSRPSSAAKRERGSGSSSRKNSARRAAQNRPSTAGARRSAPQKGGYVPPRYNFTVRSLPGSGEGYVVAPSRGTPKTINRPPGTRGKRGSAKHGHGGSSSRNNLHQNKTGNWHVPSHSRKTPIQVTGVVVSPTREPSTSTRKQRPGSAVPNRKKAGKTKSKPAWSSGPHKNSVATRRSMTAWEEAATSPPQRGVNINYRQGFRPRPSTAGARRHVSSGSALAPTASSMRKMRAAAVPSSSMYSNRTPRKTRGKQKKGTSKKGSGRIAKGSTTRKTTNISSRTNSSTRMNTSSRLSGYDARRQDAQYGGLHIHAPFVWNSSTR